MAGTDGSTQPKGCRANKIFKRMLKGLVAKSTPVALTEEQLRKLFIEHDRDKDGRLNKKELEAAFRSLGSRAPAWRADQAMYNNDLDLDGMLNEQEMDHLVAYALQYGYTVE